MEVVYLDDQRAEPIGAALRVPLAAGEVRHLAARDRNAFAVRRGHPAAAFEATEELTKARDVRANLPTRGNLNHVDVCFPGSGGQFCRTRIAALNVDDGHELVRYGAEENQRPILAR